MQRTLFGKNALRGGILNVKKQRSRQNEVASRHEQRREIAILLKFIIPKTRSESKRSVREAYSLLDRSIPEIVFCSSHKDAFEKMTIAHLAKHRQEIASLAAYLDMTLSLELGSQQITDQNYQQTSELITRLAASFARDASEQIQGLFVIPKSPAIALRRKLDLELKFQLRPSLKIMLPKNFDLIALITEESQTGIKKQLWSQLKQIFFAILKQELYAAWDGSQNLRLCINLWTQTERLLSLELERKSAEGDAQFFWDELTGMFYLGFSLLNHGGSNRHWWSAFQFLLNDLLWVYTMDDTCFTCDHPQHLLIDKQTKIPMAIQFVDGYRISLSGQTLLNYQEPIVRRDLPRQSQFDAPTYTKYTTYRSEPSRNFTPPLTTPSFFKTKKRKRKLARPGNIIGVIVSSVIGFFFYIILAIPSLIIYILLFVPRFSVYLVTSVAWYILQGTLLLRFSRPFTGERVRQVRKPQAGVNFGFFNSPPKYRTITKVTRREDKFYKMLNLNIPIKREQQALINSYQQKWLQLALSPQSIDVQKAKKAVQSLYEELKLTPPEIMVVPSPARACQILNYLNLDLDRGSIINKLERKLKCEKFFDKCEALLKFSRNYVIPTDGYIHQLRRSTAISEQIKNKVMRRFIVSLEDSLKGSNYIIPDFCISFAECLDFQINGLKINTRKARVSHSFLTVIQECGWIFPLRDVCIICDRPEINLDNEYRLHAEGKPAVKYTDGFNIYANHGVILPERYGKLHPVQWRSQWILEERNAELRRILIQEIGYDRICQELCNITLDWWKEYSLLRLTVRFDDPDPPFLLKMTCPSTGHIHALRVPPTIRSAREAIRWVNGGIDPEEFSVAT